jgi:hypothetical protein
MNAHGNQEFDVESATMNCNLRESDIYSDSEGSSTFQSTNTDSQYLNGNGENRSGKQGNNYVTILGALRNNKRVRTVAPWFGAFVAIVLIVVLLNIWTKQGNVVNGKTDPIMRTEGEKEPIEMEDEQEEISKKEDEDEPETTNVEDVQQSSCCSPTCVIASVCGVMVSYILFDCLACGCWE